MKPNIRTYKSKYEDGSDNMEIEFNDDAERWPVTLEVSYPSKEDIQFMVDVFHAEGFRPSSEPIEGTHEEDK